MVEPIDMLQRDERAAEATELLDNPLLFEILLELENEATHVVLIEAAGSQASMAAIHKLHAVRALRADLIRLVDDPKMLRAAADRRRRLSQ